jgi:hypothetical protein
MSGPAKVLKTPLTRYNDTNRGIQVFPADELKGYPVNL